MQNSQYICSIFLNSQKNNSTLEYCNDRSFKARMRDRNDPSFKTT